MKRFHQIKRSNPLLLFIERPEKRKKYHNPILPLTPIRKRNRWTHTDHFLWRVDLSLWTCPFLDDLRIPYRLVRNDGINILLSHETNLSGRRRPSGVRLDNGPLSKEYFRFIFSDVVINLSILMSEGCQWLDVCYIKT